MAERKGSDGGAKKPKSARGPAPSFFSPTGFAHRLKNEVATFVGPSLFSYYMPKEIIEVLDLFIFFLDKHAVGPKTAQAMKDVIIKSLVELFILFDDGLVPSSDFREVYGLFRRVCALCKNTFLRQQAENYQAIQEKSELLTQSQNEVKHTLTSSLHQESASSSEQVMERKESDSLKKKRKKKKRGPRKKSVEATEEIKNEENKVEEESTEDKENESQMAQTKKAKKKRKGSAPSKTKKKRKRRKEPKRKTRKMLIFKPRQ